MMKTIAQIPVFLALVLSSCSSNEPNRTELIEQQLSIRLPDSHETILNEYETLEIIPSEYRIMVEIGFDQKGYKEVKDQILNVPYYNELHQYLRSENSRAPQMYDADVFQVIKDSLTKQNFHGSWIKVPDGHVYVDILGPDTGESVEAMLNANKKILTFKYMNI